MQRSTVRSPTAGLFLGLIITIAAVVAYSWYTTQQIAGLRALQNNIADRNRKDSLQLLRIQNDLNSLALAMRDMLDNDEPYPLTAWAAQFQRIRSDLDDAVARGGRTGPGPSHARAAAIPGPVARAVLGCASIACSPLAQDGKQDEARTQIRLSLQARQAALSTAVARLLVQNNESEEQADLQIAADLRPACSARCICSWRRR